MMGKKNKYWLILISLLILLIIGCYFSGWILLTWIQPPLKSLNIATIFQYLFHYSSHPIFGYKIKVSALIGFGLPCILWFLSLIFIFKKKSDIYGKAKFATSSELANAEFFKSTPTSIVVGKQNGQYLFYSGQQFALLAAPTRSGKGVGIVIPNLLSYQGSIVVLDIKQENFELTSKFREHNGQEVYLFNPYAEDKKSHRWNPLNYVSSDPDFRISDLMSIANMLYPIGENPKDRFWLNQAQNVFLAITLFMFDEKDFNQSMSFFQEHQTTCTMGRLYRLSSGDGISNLKDYFQGMANQPFLSESAKTAFSSILSQADETFSNIMATFKEPLLPWLNPVVDASTAGDDFLLTDLRKKKMTIYIGIQPNKLAESRLIINLFFSQLINQNTKELPQNNPNLKHQCLLLMDEFTSLGPIDILAKSVSYMAGYNLRLFPIIQSIAQLETVYGKEASRTLVTNHALQILFTPREQQDANEYSEMLGYHSIKKTNITKGRERSVNEGEERRALMLPQELKSMPNTKQIIIYEGVENPIMCDKIRYYEETIFKKRLEGKSSIPKLNI